MNDPESNSAMATDDPQPEGTRIGPMLLCEEKADELHVEVRPGIMRRDSQAVSRERDIARKQVVKCLDWSGKFAEADEPGSPPVSVSTPPNMTGIPAAKHTAWEKSASEKPGHLTNEDQFRAWCERKKWDYVPRVAEPYSLDEIRLHHAPPGWVDDLTKEKRLSFYNYLMGIICTQADKIAKSWMGYDFSLFRYAQPSIPLAPQEDYDVENGDNDDEQAGKNAPFYAQCSIMDPSVVSDNPYRPEKPKEEEGNTPPPESVEVEIPIKTETTDIRTFPNRNRLCSVRLPDGITRIGGRTFAGCTHLTSVEIPGSVESIGEGAFAGCTSLASINIPGSVERIEEGAFAGCTSLTSIRLSDSVQTIGAGLFAGCTGLTEVVFPAHMESIGEEAFLGCAGLTSVDIPADLKTVGKGAFAGCTRLTSIRLPDSVQAIGEKAFAGCTDLNSVGFPDRILEIGNGAFAGCTRLTSIRLPDSVQAIGEKAFAACTNLKSVSFPDDIPEIGNGAFAGCKCVELPGHLDYLFEPDAAVDVGKIIIDVYGASGAAGRKRRPESARKENPNDEPYESDSRGPFVLEFDDYINGNVSVSHMDEADRERFSQKPVSRLNYVFFKIAENSADKPMKILFGKILSPHGDVQEVVKAYLKKEYSVFGVKTETGERHLWFCDYLPEPDGSTGDPDRKPKKQKYTYRWEDHYDFLEDLEYFDEEEAKEIYDAFFPQADRDGRANPKRLRAEKILFVVRFCTPPRKNGKPSDKTQSEKAGPSEKEQSEKISRSSKTMLDILGYEKTQVSEIWNSLFAGPPLREKPAKNAKVSFRMPRRYYPFKSRQIELQKLLDGVENPRRILQWMVRQIIEEFREKAEEGDEEEIRAFRFLSSLICRECGLRRLHRRFVTDVAPDVKSKGFRADPMAGLLEKGVPCQCCRYCWCGGDPYLYNILPSKKRLSLLRNGRNP